ncbi:hypothetical protein Trydic_g23548 [Trypoxylus dichotomus]
MTLINAKLIHRLGVILEVINCNSSTDSQISVVYKIYRKVSNIIQLYPWYYMPLTIHKILIHRVENTTAAALSIGWFSDAQESRHKGYKYYRLHFTKICFRTATNKDVSREMLESSDPYITHLRSEPKKKHLSISEEALELMLSF